VSCVERKQPGLIAAYEVAGFATEKLCGDGTIYNGVKAEALQ
jgi:hypothetical protein